MRRQKPTISSLSVRPIKPASVTHPASSLKGVWFTPQFPDYRHDRVATA